jgi:hypothetical protein
VFALSFASYLARGQQKLIKCLSKHLVMTFWVSQKQTNDILKKAECQLTTNILDNLQLAQCRKMLQKVIRKGHRQMIHDVCNIVEPSYGRSTAFWQMNST